ncbi:MAG: DNA repair protein RecO [Clostridia bacterium]|nr:DNA repair protein RecO [Clostridia bacterium]
MGVIKTKGIVIASANSSDNDKVLTILTPDLGKISAFYKGAKKSKTASLNSSEYLSFSDLVLYKSPNDNYSINNAETIEVFYNLRVDIDKLNYATAISKMVYDVTEENIPSYDILQLFLNTLYVISETDKNLDLVFSVFQIRLLAILGFLPQIDRCINCDEPMVEEMEEFYFSIKDDGVKCKTCQKLDKSIIRLSKASFSAIVYALSCDAKKLYSFELPQDDIDELKVFTKLYTTQKLDKEYNVIKM